MKILLRFREPRYIAMAGTLLVNTTERRQCR